VSSPAAGGACRWVIKVSFVIFVVNFAFKNKTTQAFTLIELLIVITIIGILVAIVVGIIDPESKQNMAHDGVSKAIMNKVILSTEGFISSYGRAPDETEFIYNLEITVNELFGSECSYVFAPDNECLFTVASSRLPETCNLSYWKGNNLETQPCAFRYAGGIQGNPGRFRVYVKSMGLADELFVYDNQEGGKIYHCPYTVADFESLAEECE